MAKNDFQYGGWNYDTRQCGTIMTLISPGDCTGALCNVAWWLCSLQSWQGIHQVAPHCNVICGSGMTCRWIRLVPAPCNVTQSCGITTLNSSDGSTLQCGRWHWDDMPCNSPYWNSTSGFGFDHITTVDMSFCTNLPNFIQIGPPSAEKMTSCRFSRWRISAILDFRGPIIGSVISRCTTSYRSPIDTIALNCLVFEKIAFLQFQDRQTNRWTRPLHEPALTVVSGGLIN